MTCPSVSMLGYYAFFSLQSRQIVGLNLPFLLVSKRFPQALHFIRIGGLGSRSLKRLLISALISESFSVFKASVRRVLANSTLLSPNKLENFEHVLPIAFGVSGSKQTKFSGYLFDLSKSITANRI